MWWGFRMHGREEPSLRETEAFFFFCQLTFKSYQFSVRFISYRTSLKLNEPTWMRRKQYMTRLKSGGGNAILFCFVNLCPEFIFSHSTVVMYTILYVNDVTVISSLFIEAVWLFKAELQVARVDCKRLTDKLLMISFEWSKSISLMPRVVRNDNRTSQTEWGCSRGVAAQVLAPNCHGTDVTVWCTQSCQEYTMSHNGRSMCQFSRV